MELSRVKLSSSLSWLSGAIQEHQSHEQLETAKHLLLNPYGVTSGYKELKGEVVALLTAPALYHSAYRAIFPSETPDTTSFWPLIHGLAKHGIYLLEDDDVAVNHSVLAQSTPFRKGSHLALLDGLMTAYASSVVSVERVVKAVRRVSTFNPSRELPCGVEDSLLLWLNKVSEAVGREQREEAKRKLKDPDARQRRRNRLQLMSEGETMIPRATDLRSAVTGGQCLAALLVHYIPHNAKWSDFRFSVKPLSGAHCLQNLTKVRDICSSHLPPPGFHLTPENLLQFGQSETLKANVLTLLAHLFRCFELGITGRTLGESKTSGNGTIANGAAVHSSTNVRIQANQNRVGSRENLASRRSLFRQDHPGERLPPSRHSLSSYSTSHLPSERHTGMGGANITIGSSFHRLSSFSTSALETTHRGPLISRSTVFNAPLRTSLTASQSIALAGFHQQPKPSAAHLEPTNRNPHPLITVSTDNLRIREQMASERRKRRRPVRYSASLSSSSSGSSSPAVELSLSGAADADISGNSTGSWHPSTCQNVNPNPTSNGNSSAATFTSQPQASQLHMRVNGSAVSPEEALRCGVDSSEKEDRELRGSFTIDKCHTLASASAAGLPIVKPTLERQCQHADASDGVGTEGRLSTFSQSTSRPGNSGRGSTSHSQEVDRKKPHSRSSSGSSSGSAASGIRVLRLFRMVPKPEESPDHGSSYLPPEVLRVRQEMKEREREIRTEQARLEEQLALEKKQFHQQVFEALLQGQGSKVKAPSSSLPRECQLLQPAESRPSETSLSSLYDGQVGVPNGAPHPKVPPVLSKASLEETHSDSESDTGMEEPISAVGATLRPPAIISATVQTPMKTHPVAGTEIKDDVTVPSITISAADKPGSPPPSIPLGIQCSTGRKSPQHQSQSGPAHSLQQIPLSPILAPGSPGSGNDGSSGTATQQNPWTVGSAGADKTKHLAGQKKVHSESDVLRQREQQVRARLEERDRARRTAMEQRRKQMAKNRTLQEPPRASELTMQASEDTLHFKLSEQPWERTDPIPSAAPLRGDFLTHNGPECYVRPQAKSNRKIIANALCHVCLAGEVNMSLKQRALAELESSSANHFFVLFRDTVGCKFRALYSYTPEANHVTKIFGSGPKVIKQHMIAGLHKYNCGAKAFKPIPTKSFSLSLDAITIKNEYWTSKKVSSKPPSGAFR